MAGPGAALAEGSKDTEVQSLAHTTEPAPPEGAPERHTPIGTGARAPEYIGHTRDTAEPRLQGYPIAAEAQETAAAEQHTAAGRAEQEGTQQQCQRRSSRRQQRDKQESKRKDGTQ